MCDHNDTQDYNISVIIPVYNGQKYLKQAVLSAINQTLPPHEIILVDDGSTDNSAAIIRELAQQYPLRYYYQENRGQAAARNVGAAVSTGNLLAFLDQDDLWYPPHLEELAKPFRRHTYPELGWVYSNVDLIGPRGDLYHLGFLDIMPGPHPKRSIFDCLASDMFVVPSATMVSKKAFMAVGGFDERLSGYEDDDLFIRIFTQGYGNVYLNQSLTQWRLHSGSCSRSMRFAESRMIYAKKLLATYTDNRELGLYFHNNFILPRFINIIISDWHRALSAKEKMLARRLQDDLQTLLPYMNVSLKIKSSIMAFLLRTIGRHPFFRPVIKLYWLVEMVSRRLRLAYA